MHVLSYLWGSSSLFLAELVVSIREIKLVILFVTTFLYGVATCVCHSTRVLSAPILCRLGDKVALDASFGWLESDRCNPPLEGRLLLLRWSFSLALVGGRLAYHSNVWPWL
jgi:hypothetical protein